MTKNTIQTIRKKVTVNASQGHAFDVFTQKIDLWWPRTHHIGKTPMISLVLEPRANGRWYSTHEDGSECNVGFILVWEPKRRIVLAWQINADFEYVASLISEVEVKFIADGPERTIVEFEHRNLDRLGDGRKAIDSMDEGWGMILNLYAEIANGA